MPFCLQCRKSFPDDAATCPDHGASLVEELPFQTVEGPDHSTWVEIYSPPTEDEAVLLKGFLEAEGIPAELESLKLHVEPVNVGALSEIRLYVKAADEERSIELLRKRESDYEALAEEEVSTDDGPSEIDDDSETAEGGSE